MAKPYTRRSLGQWQTILSEQQASGLKQQRFCEQEGISYGSFQTWRKRLMSAAAEPEFVEIPCSQYALPLESGLTVRLELGACVVLELSRPVCQSDSEPLSSE